MPLNTTRTPPQRSFGRRPGASPASPQATVPLSEPPVEVPAEPPAEIPREPAQNWLSEIAGLSRPQQSRPERPATDPQPALPSAADQPAIQPQEVQTASLSALGIVTRGLAVLTRNPVTFLAVLAAVVLTEQVVGLVPASVGVPDWMVLPLLTTMGCMALYAAAFHAAMSSLKGERVNFDLSLRAMAGTPPSAYGVIAVTVSSLSLLLIVPAFGLAWRWVLAAPVALVEGGQARARAVALAAPYRGLVRRLVLLLAGLSILRGLLMMLWSPDRVLTVMTSDWLFPMLLTLFTAVTSAVLYRELVSRSPETPAS